MPTHRGLYVRIGALILVGLGLGLGFLLFLTGGGFGRQSMIFETYLRESVTGLEVGAPVRYRGVQVGQVSKVGLVNAEYPPTNRNAAVEAFQLVLVRLALDTEKATMDDPKQVERAVERGLRARLATQGITGVAYIELDFVNPERFPGRDVPWAPAYPVIPAIPSTVAQVQNAAETILARIQQAPLEELLNDVTAVVSAVRGQVESGDLAHAFTEAAAMLGAVRQAVTQSDIPATVAELRGAAADLRALLGSAETKAALASARAAADDLRESLSRLPAVINALEQAARSARNTTQSTTADLVPLLRDLRATVGNLRDTTEALRRAPGQVLFGAPPPPNR
ncbi:MCE family protein [Roseomonas sp. M0104]|uniref:MCE family protein n=1 Tax=Teichococcus coralli TaxID=2545983 RepID=A0A845BHV8_9PROT|nr:MlaD family protein [Pseudoroseomonas coralli]MXP65670.1 MCE family protein [Pseudoroseomonas coralli]